MRGDRGRQAGAEGVQGVTEVVHLPERGRSLRDHRIGRDLVAEFFAEGHRAVGLEFQAGVLLEHHADAGVDVEAGTVARDDLVAHTSGRRDEVIDVLEAIAQVAELTVQVHAIGDEALDADSDEAAIDVLAAVLGGEDVEALGLEDRPGLRVALQIERQIEVAGVLVALCDGEARAKRARPHGWRWRWRRAWTQRRLGCRCRGRVLGQGGRRYKRHEDCTDDEGPARRRSLFIRHVLCPLAATSKLSQAGRSA